MMRGRGFAWLAAVATAGFAAAGDETVPAVQPPPQPAGAGAPLLDLDGLRQARALPPPAELFAAKSWYVAPPPAPAPPPPAPVVHKPAAPPLPFVFMGRMVQDGRLTVFLQQGDLVHMVREGDVIDEAWLVRRIEPGQLTLVYVPLQIEQTLAVEDPA